MIKYGNYESDRRSCLSMLPLLPYIVINMGRVVEVSCHLIDLSGYVAKDFTGRTPDDVLKMLFKRSPDKLLTGEEGSSQLLYLFTRSDYVRVVDAAWWEGLLPGERIYTFIERPGCRIEKDFPTLYKLISSNITGMALYSVSDDTVLLMANQRYMDFIGNPLSSPAGYLGFLIQDIVPGWEKSGLKAAFERVTGENVAVKVEGSLPWVNLPAGGSADDLLMPVYAEGRMVFIAEHCGILAPNAGHREVPENNNLELRARMEELERTLKYREELFSFVSHEFKTPLTVISAAVQAIDLLCREELSEKGQKFFKQIKQNSMRLLRLVNGLLDITRAEGGYMKLNKRNMDIVLVAGSITESVNLYAGEKGINVSFNSSFEKKVIALDDEKFERILLNLLSNAIKFTPAGKNVYVRLYARKNHVCVEVKDEGIGIPGDKKKVIFNMFGRVENELAFGTEGTGIGLYLVKLLVKAFKGRITVRDNAGGGCTFTVMLPDETLPEDMVSEPVAPRTGNRLIQTAAIEFSDIYLQK